jgi:muconolactone delta-isomerase
MKCLVTIRFNPQQRAEINALIPREQAHIKMLMERGIVQTLYISTDRLQIWVIMQSDSQMEVEQELQAFPLYPYMQAEITPLL